MLDELKDRTHKEAQTEKVPRPSKTGGGVSLKEMVYEMESRIISDNQFCISPAS